MVSERKFSIVKNWQFYAAIAGLIGTWAVHGWQIVNLTKDVDNLKSQIGSMQESIAAMKTDIRWIKEAINRKRADADGTIETAGR